MNKLFILQLIFLPILSLAQAPKDSPDKPIADCNLSFRYIDAPDRLVTEFTANVVGRGENRNDAGEQKCSDKVAYRHGNYHITINTFPQEIRNVDIEDGETVILLEQPGYMKFIHDEKIVTVTLYRQLQNEFVAFATVDLKNITAQSLKIQPGRYQVRYRKTSTDSSEPEKIVPFAIRANEEKTIQLK